MTKNQITKNLRAIAEELPKGAISRIAEKVGKSQSYVSKFFNGEYHITDNNIGILDEADRILKEDAEKKEGVEARLNEILSKGKE